jgi:hypothetical protein
MTNRYRRKAEVQAIKLPGPIMVGDQEGRAGDYLVWESPGEMPVVMAAAEFERLYEPDRPASSWPVPQPYPVPYPYPVYPRPWRPWEPLWCGGGGTYITQGSNTGNVNIVAADAGVRLNLNPAEVMVPPGVVALTAHTFRLKE